MTLLRQRLLVLALILCAWPALASRATRAQRAYDAAVAAFQIADYPRAEAALAQFVQDFPDSTNVPSAFLLQAQSAFKQGDFTNCITLLAEHTGQAGGLADQYVYWTGEAQFAGNDFLAAADAFGSLAQRFPDSSLRLRATVEQASSLAWANQWPQAIDLLGGTNGVFQRAAQLDPNNDLVSRGRQLQAQGLFIEGHYDRASAILNSINPQILTPDQEAGLERLLYQLNLTTTNLPAAFQAATNLFQTAKIAADRKLLAESTVMRANVLEKMGRTADAIAAYAENLTNNSPPDAQRNAIQAMAALAIQHLEFPPAEAALQNYLTNFPSSDAALFALGELQLRDHLTQPAETNLITAAHANLDQFISTFTNSPLLGLAYLNCGWCFWVEQKPAESLTDFQAAAGLLPSSEDLAVAEFKTGDAQFARGDFTNALQNYLAVANDFTNFPAVMQDLGGRALYQVPLRQPGIDQYRRGGRRDGPNFEGLSVRRIGLPGQTAPGGKSRGIRTDG